MKSILNQVMREDNVNVFMNIDDFGETHTVNGREMTIIIDDDKLDEHEVRIEGADHGDGIYAKQSLFYVRAADFGRRPANGSILKLDGKTYIVTKTISAGGIYTIEIEAKRS